MSSVISPAESRTVYRIYAALLALLIVVVLAATIRDWMDWGGDDAMYIMNARDLALGQPYGGTLYIHNPLNPIHPAAPPPGLPLMLAPVYTISGLDWAQFKLACVAAFGLFLVVLVAIAGEWLQPLWALLAVAFMGLHPYTWQLKETIPPEFSFMFFAYAALWLADRCVTSIGRLQMLTMVGAAVCATGAYLTRPIGIVLFPAIVLASLCQTRKLTNAGVAAAVIGFVLAWSIEQFVHPDLGTYMGYLDGFGLQSLERNLKAYSIASRYFLEDHTYARTLRGYGLLVVLAGVVAIGFAARVRTRFSAFEWFTLGYAALLMIYPINLEPDRYSYPIWPLIVLYGFLGYDRIGRHLPARWRYVPAALLACVFMMNYGLAYKGIIRLSGVDYARAADANAAYKYLKQHLPANAVVIARQPTVIALVANRRSAIWPAHCDDQQFRAYMAAIRAQYLLQDMDFGKEHLGKVDDLASFVSRNTGALQLVYSHGAFRLYRLAS